MDLRKTSQKNLERFNSLIEAVEKCATCLRCKAYDNTLPKMNAVWAQKEYEADESLLEFLSSAALAFISP